MEMALHKKLIILCFLDYYLPGFNYGGPVRSIQGLVKNLSDDFDIRIVTRNIDFGATHPYQGVIVDGWNDLDNAKVYYASGKTICISGLLHLLKTLDYDVLYLNGSFSPKFTILPLVLRRFGLIPLLPCVVSPRGQFSAGALAIKKSKKSIFLFFSKVFGLYSNLSWQASSNYEAMDIKNALGNFAGPIIIAPDLSSNLTRTLTDIDCVTASHGQSALRMIFLSRISKMKNLEFLINVLMKVRIPVSLTICGPIEDHKYWNSIEILINELPDNVLVEYIGAIDPKNVWDTFRQFDLFVFPTKGENFGHVILESLSAGTPVLVSNKTPWQSEITGSIKALPLDEASWCREIESFAGIYKSNKVQLRLAAFTKALEQINNIDFLKQNRELFLNLVSH